MGFDTRLCLQIECRRLVFGDVRSVTRFPVTCAVTIRAHTLHCKADAYGNDNRCDIDLCSVRPACDGCQTSCTCSVRQQTRERFLTSCN